MVDVAGASSLADNLDMPLAAVALRALHQVRSLTEAEEGNGIHRLPGGVYGSTYAPGLLPCSAR